MVFEKFSSDFLTDEIVNDVETQMIKHISNMLATKYLEIDYDKNTYNLKLSIICPNCGKKVYL